MEAKKRLFLLLSVILLFLNLASFFITFTLTGNAVESTSGTASICLTRAPTITSIADQTATIDAVFALQVEATFYGSNSSTSYFDNTALFDINQSGYISFTPSSVDIGTKTIDVTVQDASSSCSLTINASDTFILTISAAAAPAAEAAGGGVGGAAGAPKAAEIKKISFQLSDPVLKVAFKKSRTIQKIITLSNDGETELKMEVINPLAQVIDVVPSTFTILPGQKQELRFLFNPRQNVVPGIYSDFITIRGTFGSRIEKKIATVVEVESEEVLVDASLDLLRKVFSAGGELEVTITLFNLRQTVPVDVTIIYLVSKVKHSIVYEEKEVITVKEQASFSKKIALPEDLPPGEYLLSLKIIYGDSFATATEIFTIEEPVVEEKKPLLLKPLPLTAIISTLTFLTAAIFILLYFTYRKIRKTRTILKPIITQKTIIQKGRPIIKKETIIKQKTIIQPRTIIMQGASGLRRKLAILKESRERGFISEQAFREGRAKLQKLIEKREKYRKQ